MEIIFVQQSKCIMHMTSIIERYRSNTISRISVTHGHGRDYYDRDRGRDRDQIHRDRDQKISVTQMSSYHVNLLRTDLRSSDHYRVIVFPKMFLRQRGSSDFAH